MAAVALTLHMILSEKSATFRDHALSLLRHSEAARSAEPGIHNGIDLANPPWIPGSGFAGPE
jgi:hypothetical protein